MMTTWNLFSNIKSSNRTKELFLSQIPSHCLCHQFSLSAFALYHFLSLSLSLTPYSSLSLSIGPLVLVVIFIILVILYSCIINLLSQERESEGMHLLLFSARIPRWQHYLAFFIYFKKPQKLTRILPEPLSSSFPSLGNIEITAGSKSPQSIFLRAK